nr:MAG TPA: hypothetical protein [Bacteriophage sp.]
MNHWDYLVIKVQSSIVISSYPVLYTVSKKH